MKFSKSIFNIFFFLYLLFPGDNQFREIGIGSEGFRLLLPDILLLLIFIGVIPYYIKACYNIKKKIAAIPVLFFIGVSIISLIRGIPQYGGMALGESRWFFSIIMLPAGFIFYQHSLIEKIKRIILFCAIVHGVEVIINYTTGNAWDVVGDVERYGGGRQSLIIGIAIIVLVQMYVGGKTRTVFGVWIPLIILFLISCLFVGQTRTIFLMLPIGVLIISIVFGALQFTKIVRFILFGIIFIISFWIVLSNILPQKTLSSISASFSVVTEAFDPETYRLILDPDMVTDKTNWEAFSKSGNTLFRVVAWSQTIANINNYPGGWIWGLPMGAGFGFYMPHLGYLENMQPHNDYLVIISKTGLIGLISYLLILIKYFHKTIKLKLKYSIEFLYSSDIFLISTIIVMILLFVFLNAEIRTYGTHFWIWFFLGFGFKSLDKLNGNEFP